MCPLQEKIVSEFLQNQKVQFGELQVFRNFTSCSDSVFEKHAFTQCSNVFYVNR